MKRQKYEGQLYQVKTNKEYSAVLVEIEEVKQEKSRIEEDILALMETQERLAAELKEAEAGGRARERGQEPRKPTLAETLRGVEVQLAMVRSERAATGRQLSAQACSTDYDRHPASSRRRRRRGDQAELLRRLSRDHHAPAASGAAPAERAHPLRVLRSLPLLDRRLSSTLPGPATPPGVTSRP